MLLDTERAEERRTVAELVRSVCGQDPRRSLATAEPSPDVAAGLGLRKARFHSRFEEEVLGLFVGDGAGTDEPADGSGGSEGSTSAAG